MNFLKLTLSCLTEVTAGFDKNFILLNIKMNSCTENEIAELQLASESFSTYFKTEPFSLSASEKVETLNLTKASLNTKVNETFSFFSKNLYQKCKNITLISTQSNVSFAFKPTDCTLPNGDFEIEVEKVKNKVYILVLGILAGVIILAAIIALAVVCTLRNKRKYRLIHTSDAHSLSSGRNLFLETHVIVNEFADKLRRNVKKLEALEAAIMKTGMSRRQMSLIGYYGNPENVGGLMVTLVQPKVAAVDDMRADIGNRPQSNSTLGGDEISHLSGKIF